MLEVLDWTGPTAHEAIRRARSHLLAGRVVVMPSDLGYESVVSGLHPQTVAALKETLGPDEQLPVGLGHFAEARDWLPFLRGAGVQMVHRLWPGPLTIVGEAGYPWGNGPRLPESAENDPVRARVGLRMPAHPALAMLLHGSEVPLLLGAVAEDDPVRWAKANGDRVGLVVREETPQARMAATVVHVNGKDWEVVRAGAIAKAEIAAAAACRILFVCTGNTCRSPLAQALCSTMLAERLRSEVGGLSERGFVVSSAGLAAGPGNEATLEAVAVALAKGADLSGHRSQPVTAELLADANFVVTMTLSQLRLLQSLRLGPRPRLLSSRDEDIDDPIGGAPEVYAQCARQIEAELLELIPEFLEGATWNSLLEVN